MTNAHGSNPARRHRAALALLASAWLAACAGPGEVQEADRDVSGTYDGRWVATLAEGKPASFATNNWTIRCTSQAGSYPFTVEDGVVAFAAGDGEEAPSSFVDADGRFVVTVPLDSWEVSSRESGPAGESEQTLVMTGGLGASPPTLKLTVAQSYFGGGGCSWPLQLERQAS